MFSNTTLFLASCLGGLVSLLWAYIVANRAEREAREYQEMVKHILREYDTETELACR